MSFFGSLDTSATALTAQRLRMDVISQNMANVDTTRTEKGGPYKRKVVLFQEIGSKASFAQYLGKAMDSDVGQGVRVTRIVDDETPGSLTYDPTHPDANEDGYVTNSNVNIVEEMVNMISANRSYEANITAINTTKSMIAKTLEIGK
ncbi:MAG: flagellar basal body rod protein FlgC [Clostridiales bacterium]|jgi:flagellar basal-body rod protein FlgC|nr:flagellar basal body rod protein FlgC [Clostridiales bacterium]